MELTVIVTFPQARMSLASATTGATRREAITEELFARALSESHHQ